MALYRPRVWLSVNGNTIPCKSGSVTKKAKRAADTFECVISITRSTAYGMSVADWADFQSTDVELIMSVLPDASDVTSMIVSRPDVPKIDWNDYTVSLSGRDKTSSLIETRRSQKFASQKSSDIVSTIASDNGLTPVVSSSSSGYAGKQYNSGDVNHLALHRTDFEILSDLADREGYRWYVSGLELHFEPKDQSGNVLSGVWYPPMTLRPFSFATVRSLTTSRNMTAARPTNVSVKSWHAKDRKLYVGQAQAPGVGDTLNVDHHHNGKTQDEADTLAQSRATDAIRHDCNATVRMAIDLTVDPKTTQFALSGTGTIYDQTYELDTAKFDVSWDDGGEMELTCKSPNGRTVSQGGADDGTDSASGDSGDSGSIPTPPPRPADLDNTTIST